MHFSMTAVLALAAAAAAAPNPAPVPALAPLPDGCKQIICTKKSAVKLDAGVAIDVLGIEIQLDVVARLLAVLFPKCEITYCCPIKVDVGLPIPSVCSPYKTF
ncbi:hypothetical protein E4U53_004480 [Claviceps sorghi]|nr:hypothetical protein E4U53_004480 [Claviceps sorghi]